MISDVDMFPKFPNAPTEAHNDNFRMQLYTSTPKMSVHQCAFGMTPFLCDSWALIFTARCYASAVYAVVVCPSACLSVCHKPALYQYG